MLYLDDNKILQGPLFASHLQIVPCSCAHDATEGVKLFARSAQYALLFRSYLFIYPTHVIDEQTSDNNFQQRALEGEVTKSRR